MTVRLLTMWRRCLLLSAPAFVAISGCRSDMDAWRSRLAASEVRHMVGLWLIAVRRESHGGDSAGSRWVTGQLALTVNEERLDSHGFGEPPMFFGSYNIDLSRVGLGAATEAGMPAVIGRLRGDTLELRLAAQSNVPVILAGVAGGDSVLGRWVTHRRAGADVSGDFVLRRR